MLAGLTVALRLLLLPHHPVPTPDVYDEFGHLLVADTLRHFRLANPPHALSQFFETFFVLQEPTYSSIYPLGQGIALAIGWTLFGLPWAGVVLSVSAFCAACYWMLQAWTSEGWALAGGLLAVIEFGPLNPWMNCYWGGAFAAFGGCLVFGALPRICRRGTVKDAVILAVGFSIHFLTRPYESIFLTAGVVGYFVVSGVRGRAAETVPSRSRLGKLLLTTLLCLLPAVGLTLLQNKAVTGSWTTLPYQLSQYQYGVPSSLTFQKNPVPHRELTPQQALDYKMQLNFHGPKTDTLSSYLLRMEYRVRFYRFFFLPELYLVLPFFLLRLKEWRYAWAAGTCLLFALGINFFPAFQFHYLAGCTGLFVLIGIAGLERLSRITVFGNPVGLRAAQILLFLCFAQFAFWYTVHLFEDSGVGQVREYETWNGINHDNGNPRTAVNEDLAHIPGKLLVFVRYSPRHLFQREWVYNRADIDSSRVVWARDLGTDEDEKLIRYFPDRRVLLLEPDFNPPQLSAYKRQ
ncbi:MAG TPA: hypothetical protein VF023_05330 [Bryobacteraceae bacterium]